MSDEVAERIRAAVADHGPITFAEFMEVALYGPGGFYERPPIGEGGHFVTSPHVHDIFAILLAKALRSMQEEGRFDPFTVVEVGAGDGTLARQLMTELGDLPVEYHAIDRSTGAREELSRLPVTVHPMLEVAPAHIDGCFLANELLDNLPFHRVRQTRNGLREIRIDVLKDGFIEVETPVNDEVMEEIENVPRFAPREESVVPVAALHFLDRVARVLHRGYVVLIDYAKTEGSTVHGYQRHRVVADVLADPGSADITAGVDFDLLADRARRWGFEVSAPFSQRVALDALGFGAWNLVELSRQGEALAARSGAESVRAWSGRRQASLLVDPDGLGGLRWLVLKRGDVLWPEWVSEAEAMEEFEVPRR